MFTYYKKGIIISFLLMGLAFRVSAQDILKNYEDSLVHYFSLMAEESSDQQKVSYNNEILRIFRQAVLLDDSFDYKFNKLNHAGVIFSPDDKLKIITWNLPYTNRTHKYFGFIQYKKSNREVLTFELYDNSKKIVKPEFAILDNTNWYGALYYKIIVNKYRGEEYYTLLGADLNNILSKKKLIEALYFEHNEPVFGKLVFKNTKQAVARIIFEFSSQSSMALTYDEDKEMIIFDHLSPSRPSMVGQYEFYGPDFSYDGLKFERGIWNLYPDIDVRNYNLK